MEYKGFMVEINPSMSYYVRLTDKLYYTPGVGLSLGYGSLDLQLSENDSYPLPLQGSAAYIHLLAFELKASEKIALGVSMFTIDYTNISLRENTSGLLVKMKQRNYDLNDATIYFRYYF